MSGIIKLQCPRCNFSVVPWQEQIEFTNYERVAIYIKFKEEAYFKTKNEKKLYFKNLDNNAGVFYHLIDAAEEEEFKEAVLAYYFLLTEDRDLTEIELGAAVESWFRNKHNCQINFEIADALRKLESLELVSRNEDFIDCKNLNDAKGQLDVIWDNYFRYHQPNEALNAVRSDAS